MTGEPVMKARVGDELIVKGQHVGDTDRRGVITEVHGEDGTPAIPGAVDQQPRELVLPLLRHHRRARPAAGRGQAWASGQARAS